MVKAKTKTRNRDDEQEEIVARGKSRGNPRAAEREDDLDDQREPVESVVVDRKSVV